jgi:hypothetical protein
MRSGILVIALCLPLLLGHGHGCGDDSGEIEFGPPTNAVCPDDLTLTFDNFGQRFMADYCLRCHSAEVTGEARNGAPSDHNFDTAFEIRAFADHIDWMAGAGPDATNELMPPDGPGPTVDERRQLADWLACGAP